LAKFPLNSGSQKAFTGAVVAVQDPAATVEVRHPAEA
jgi:hypothetical protein